MTPATTTPTTAASTRPAAPPGRRLQLDPTMAGTGTVDGGWWPRSRDPDAELPDLIAGLDASFGPITRLTLNLTAWDTTPRRQLDPDTIGVTRAGQNRMLLLVVPPRATTAPAGIAMAMAADAATSASPAGILAAARTGEDPAPMRQPLR